MSTDVPAFARRPDLDALRAGAMLLGIVLHASLSFFPSFWMVADRQRNDAFEVVFSAIHGFRMPLFFVMCGFFSAMLLRRRGRRAMVGHRFRRVFLPLVAGLFTIVPLTIFVSSLAISPTARNDGGAAPAGNGSNIWAAAKRGDVDAIERHLTSGEAVNGVDPEHGGTPLQWAAAGGRTEAVDLLVRRGANVNHAGRDGGTALHAAAFLGHVKTVETLLRHGAMVNVVNRDGSKPLDVATLDEGTTRYFASVLQLELDEDGLGRRKAAIAESLRRHGATAGQATSGTQLLMRVPLFQHLWFLWFLWWLVVGYAVVSALLARLRLPGPPSWLVLSPARYLWLVPLTMVPQWFMGGAGDATSFGPDTSTGPLPIPHVFAYYAIFFGFGALYHGADDRSGRVGARWRLQLAIGVLVALPLGLALAAGWDGPAALAPAPSSRRVLSVFTQAVYPWLVTFGLMGLARRACPAEDPTIRYLSDSAYWLYLAHLPLVVAAQLAVRDWPVPAFAKFALIVVVVTAFLLWTYQVMVRSTWLGRFLNGPRARPSGPWRGSVRHGPPAQARFDET